MPEAFNENGLRVVYPDNWELDESSTEEWPKSVSLQSPTSASWSVYVYEAGSKEPNEIADEALEAMRENYEDLEATAVAEEIDEEPSFGYDMHFYCLDLLILCQIRVVDANQKTHLFIAQGEDRDFTDAQPVFHAIRTSVLQKAPLPDPSE